MSVVWGCSKQTGQHVLMTCPCPLFARDRAMRKQNKERGLHRPATGFALFCSKASACGVGRKPWKRFRKTTLSSTKAGPCAGVLLMQRGEHLWNQVLHILLCIYNKYLKNTHIYNIIKLYIYILVPMLSTCQSPLPLPLLLLPLSCTCSSLVSISKEALWGTSGAPLGHLWGTSGAPLGHLSGTSEAALGHLWGTSIGQLWGNSKAPLRGTSQTPPLPHLSWRISGAPRL